MFIDEATILVRSGDGGHGCISFRREKYIPKGGPDGGNGGRGGHVILRASRGLSTLLDLSRRRHYRAECGRPGGGNQRTGRRGGDLVVDVPLGTVVKERDAETGESVAFGDLLREGETLRVARGGKGGLGNKAFATSTHQVPRTATEGGPGEERRLDLELKLLADVGLIGLPNAGKSTFLARVSAATPKIAAYPFTTLHPNLGIAELDDYRRVVLADIPGLIEGAHAGHGLGIEFLRHVERTRVLVHLVAAETNDVDELAGNYRTIRHELASYSEELGRKPQLVALSKIDLIEESQRDALARELEARLAAPVATLSAVTGTGVRALLEAAAREVESAKTRDQSA